VNRTGCLSGPPGCCCCCGTSSFSDTIRLSTQPYLVVIAEVPRDSRVTSRHAPEHIQCNVLNHSEGGSTWSPSQWSERRNCTVVFRLCCYTYRRCQRRNLFTALVYHYCLMYTTHFSTLISSRSLEHHLYADDTQFFFSFHPLNFDSSISHLQNALQHISSWLLIFLLLTPLRLNSCSLNSKTNLPKYTTLHLTPPTLLETLASSWTNILLSLTKLHLSPKPVTITFVNFAVFGLTSIRQLPVPLLICYLYRSLQTWLYYCINSLYYKPPKSQLSRFQQIQNSLTATRTVVKAPKSCHITPVLRSLHWLRINERIEYKLLSLTYKLLTTTQPPYLHNLNSTQRPRSTSSSSVVTLARPPLSSSLKVP